jgi:hypothetical protein
MSGRVEWTFFGVPIAEPGGTRVTNVTVHSEENASTLGRYLSDLGQLQSGWLSSGEFEQRWDGVRLGKFALESRPGHALEAMRRAGPPPGGERYRRSVRRDPR